MEFMARARPNSTSRALFVADMEYFFNDCVRAVGRCEKGVRPDSRHGHSRLDGGLLDRKCVKRRYVRAGGLQRRADVVSRSSVHIFAAERNASQIRRASHASATARP